MFQDIIVHFLIFWAYCEAHDFELVVICLIMPLSFVVMGKVTKLLKSSLELQPYEL